MNVLLCPFCNTENRRVRRYCRTCGSLLDFTCPRCGFPNDPGDRFCGGCGIALRHLLNLPNAVAPSPSTPSPAPSRSPYLFLTEPGPLPVELAEMASQYRLATIVMADLSGFTAMSETMDAEQVTRIMNRVFERLVPYVQRYGGHVDKYVGDMVIAFFGVPYAQESGPERALWAAVKMRDELDQLNAEQVARGHALGISMGVGTGEVVVGYVGVGETGSYTATGEILAITEQLEKIAERGQILICERTFQRVKGLFQIEHSGEATLPGSHGTASVYNVVGSLPWVDQLEQMSRRARGPIVGRDKELATLQDAWQQTQAGQGQVIGLTGSYGSGKSRLLAELRARTPAQTPWAIGFCNPFQQEEVLSPLRDWLLSLAGPAVSADPKSVVRALQTWLDDDQPGAHQLLTPLKQALGASPTDDQRQKAGEAFLQALQRVTRRHPQIVVLENLHWADAATIEYLHRLAELASQQALLVVVTLRPCLAGELLDALPLQQVNVPPLSRSETEQLAHFLLPEAEPELVETLYRWSEGNPLFLEAWVDQYQQQGWDPETFIREGLQRPPDLIREWALAHLDRLPPAARYLLQAASVAAEGKRVRLDALQYVCGALAGYSEAAEAIERKALWSLEPGSPPWVVFRHLMIPQTIRQTMLLQTQERFQAAFEAFRPLATPRPLPQ